MNEESNSRPAPAAPESSPDPGSVTPQSEQKPTEPSDQGSVSSTEAVVHSLEPNKDATDLATPDTASTPQPVTETETNLSQASTSEAESFKVGNLRIVELRSLLVKGMLGCLVAGAVVAVVAILAGSMGDIAWRAVGTIVAALIHLIILFGILSIVSSSDDRFRWSNNMVVNTGLVVSALSLFTSIFAIWDLIGGSLVTKLYATYVVVMIAVIHAKALMDINVMYEKVRYFVYANYFFILVVAIMMLFVVYVEMYRELLGGFYGRLLSASAVINVTLGAISVVMYRLHMQKHPEVAKEFKKVSGSSSVARLILILLLALFVGWPVLSALMAFALYSTRY